MAVGASLVYAISFANNHFFKKSHTAGAVMTSGLVLIVPYGVKNTIHNKYIISLVTYRLLVLVCGHLHCQDKTHSVQLAAM